MSITPPTSLLLIPLAALAIVAGGCGSDDGEGSSSPPSISEAKATLSKDCQQGKASDKPLCDCIAAKLESTGSDAEEILAINKAVNSGESPAALEKAAAGC